MNTPPKKNMLLLDATCLAAGGLLVLSFAPFNLFWLAPLCMAVLIAGCADALPKRAFLRGFLFGLTFFGFGVHWIFISIHRFGGASVFFSGLVTALFILLLALFPAFTGLFFAIIIKARNLIAAPLAIPFVTRVQIFSTQDHQRNIQGRLFRYTLHAIFVFPSLWIIFEWLRSWLFTGFPWLLLGYSQTASPLKGYAPLIGSLGISFLTTLIGALIYLFFTNQTLKRRIIYVITIILIAWVGVVLSSIPFTRPAGHPLRFSLIQGNIPQNIKWNDDQVRATMNKYETLTKAHLNSDFIIWPEAAITLPLPYADAYISKLSHLAVNHQLAIMLGIPVELNKKYYNASVLIGYYLDIYYKRHLVPFGEYLPFESLLKPLLQFFNIPMSDFTAGDKDQTLLQRNKLSIAPFICYEIAYSGLVRSFLPLAHILVVQSDDAWFGKSWAAFQHLQIGQMRALETGRPVLFSTNDGITAVIDPKGHIVSQLPRFKTGVLTENVVPMQGKTLWIGLGPWSILFIAASLLILV